MLQFWVYSVGRVNSTRSDVHVRRRQESRITQRFGLDI